MMRSPQERNRRSFVIIEVVKTNLYSFMVGASVCYKLFVEEMRANFFHSLVCFVTKLVKAVTLLACDEDIELNC